MKSYALESTFRSPLFRVLILLAMMVGFSCSVDKFDQFNRTDKEGETIFFCTTASDCVSGFRCNEVSERCEEDVEKECADLDGDKVFIGKDCLSATEDQDCDDTNKDINPFTLEACDGIDNNCNEAIDEGVDPKACPLFEGVCGELIDIPIYECIAGSQNESFCTAKCDTSSFAAECAYGPLFVMTEDGGSNRDHCDGKDNDCDGEIDEGCNFCEGACGGWECVTSGTFSDGTLQTFENCPCLKTGQKEEKDGVCVCIGDDGESIPNAGENVPVPGSGIDHDCTGELD